MPIYEYKCPNGHVFELVQRMTDEAPDACEVCGATPLERVLYPVAVHFKGSGFYTTDYGRGSRKPKDGGGDSGGSGSSESGGDGGGGEKKTEPKKAAEA